MRPVVGFVLPVSNDRVLMTPPPEDEGARTRLLLTACGFSLAALAAIGGLLLLGLHRPKHQSVVFAPPKPQVRSAASVDRIAPATGAGQARRTAARRAEAIAAQPGGQARRPAERRAGAIAASAHGRRLFSSTGIWNQRVAPSAPLDPSSGALVANLVAEVGRERTAGTGPLIQAGRPAPRFTESAPPRRAFASVLTTARFRPHGTPPRPRGSADSGARRESPRRAQSLHVDLDQLATDTLWRAPRSRKLATNGMAQLGQPRKLAKRRGYYSPQRGAERYRAGAQRPQQPASRGGREHSRMTGRAGRIDHALAINVPASRAGVFTWPAHARTVTAAYRPSPWVHMCASPPRRCQLAAPSQAHADHREPRNATGSSVLARIGRSRSSERTPRGFGRTRTGSTSWAEPRSNCWRTSRGIVSRSSRCISARRRRAHPRPQ